MALFDNPESSQLPNLPLSNAMHTLAAITQTVCISDHGQLLGSLLVERQAGAFTRQNMQAINTALNRAPLVEAHREDLEAQAAQNSLLPPIRPYPRFRRFGPTGAGTNDFITPISSPQAPDTLGPAPPTQTNYTATPSTIFSPQASDNVTSLGPPPPPQTNHTTTPSTTSSPQAPDNNTVLGPAPPTQTNHITTPSTISSPQAPGNIMTLDPTPPTQTNYTPTPLTISPPQAPDNIMTLGPILPAQMNHTTTLSIVASPQAPDYNMTLGPVPCTQTNCTTTPSTICSLQATTLFCNDSVSVHLTASFYPIKQSHRTEVVPIYLNHRT